MQKKLVCKICIVMIIMLSELAFANELGTLFDQVEKLDIQRYGYVLGAVLSREQIKTAKANPVDIQSSDTFKFRDGNLFIVAHKISNRVLIMYEEFKDASQSKIQKVIGDLYMNFDEPTIIAHDKRVYWAYTIKGKLSSAEFDKAKKNRKKPDILATIKFISDIPIMENSEKPLTGYFYYIISSEKVLQLFKDK